ncbi:MAG TPA: hypothetical protein VFV94_16350 [Polyangiaceae bacterium]|nr:hypothetical protein [Polyangiaceae bacterium]
MAGTVSLSRAVYAKPPAAKAAKQPIGVGAFSGPQSTKVRARVLKVLRESGSYEVTQVEDVKPGASARTYQNMAQGIAAEAIVVGTVSQSANLTLGVYGTNGARIDAIQIKGGTFPKLYKAIDNEVEIAVADPLGRAHAGGKGPAAAAAAAPAKDDEDEDEDEPPPKPAKAAAAKEDIEEPVESDESSDAPSSASGDDDGDDSGSSEAPPESEKGLRPLELGLGIRAYNRSFKYTGQTYADPFATPQRTLYPYNLAIAPTIWVAGRFYPGAFFTNGPLSHIGIQFRYEYGFATTANYTQPANNGTNAVIQTQLKTKASEYQIGLRGRVPVGPHELGIFGLYGNHSFVLAGDEDPNKGNGAPYAVVPDVHYHYLRFGLDARLHFSKLMLGAQVAPRFLTSMKEIDKGGVWFPGATGSGLDMGVTAGWQLLPWLMPAVGVDLVRYGFDFNNTPISPKQTVVAGGATDTYISGWVGAFATFDLGGGGGAGDVSAEVKTSEEPEAEPESRAEEPDEPEEKPKPRAEAKPKAEPKPKAKPQVEEEEEDEEEEEAPPPPKPKSKSKAKAAPVEEEEDEI